MRYLIVYIIIMLFASGCDSDPTITPTQKLFITSTPSNEAPQPINITPIIVASSIGSPTPVCGNLPDSRMILGDLGQVMNDDPRPLNVRTGPSTEFRILGRLEVGEIFLILDGPVCGDEYMWYRIRNQSFTGWIAEGELGTYYIEPYFPG